MSHTPQRTPQPGRRAISARGATKTLGATTAWGAQPRRLARGGALALLALLGGCASASSSYYALGAVPGTPAPGGPALVEVRQPGIPGYLDRNAIVRGEQDYRLDVASTQLWGEPLGDMIGRVLAEDLTQRLPGTEITVSQGVISSRPDLLVEVQVSRFDTGRDGILTLAAQVSILHASDRAAIATRSFRLGTPAAAGTAGTAALVAQMSALVAQLADRTAALLRGDRAA